MYGGTEVRVVVLDDGLVLEVSEVPAGQVLHGAGGVVGAVAVQDVDVVVHYSLEAGKCDVTLAFNIA